MHRPLQVQRSSSWTRSPPRSFTILRIAHRFDNEGDALRTSHAPLVYCGVWTEEQGRTKLGLGWLRLRTASSLRFAPSVPLRSESEAPFGVARGVTAA